MLPSFAERIFTMVAWLMLFGMDLLILKDEHKSRAIKSLIVQDFDILKKISSDIPKGHNGEIFY